MSKIAVAYVHDIVWEYDFIFNDILGNLRNKLELFPFGSPEYLKKNKEGSFVRTSVRNEAEYNKIVTPLIRKLKNYKHIILVLSQQNISDEFSLVMAKAISPTVIFYLSDELGQRKKIINMYKHTKLWLYQYNNYHEYAYLPNCIQLPLGYVSTFIDNKNLKTIKYKPISERKYVASFVGQIKQDRQIMLDEFSAVFLESELYFRPINTIWIIKKLDIKPPDLYKIYSNSIFIPVGRGNISLDCFRLYEAITAGAIPVVVGEELDVFRTFNYEKNHTPMVYASNWKDAVGKCKQLLENSAELVKLQHDCIQWFQSRVAYIQECIVNTIKSDESDLSIHGGGSTLLIPYGSDYIGNLVRIAGAIVIALILVIIIRIKNNNTMPRHSHLNYVLKSSQMGSPLLHAEHNL